MRKRYFWLMLVGLLSLALIAVGCTSDDADSPEAPGDDEEAAQEPPADGEKVLLLNNGGEPTSLDPPIGNDQSSYNVLNNIGEGLTRLSKGAPIPEPAMAEDWDVSDDGLTYTFHIRENANWTNGEPVTAEDFVYSWKRMLDPELAAPAASHAYWIAGAEEYNTGEGPVDDVQVRAVDEKTLEVTLKYPVDFFVSVVAMPQLFPVHKETVEADPNWAGSADTIVTNGPYKVEAWSHDESLTIVKNEDYWDADTVKIDRVEYAMVDDVNTAFQLYQNDELHLSSVPAEMGPDYLDHDEFVIGPRSGIEYQHFHTEIEPFHNVNIRKAFMKAIDRETIVDYVNQSGEEAAYGWVHPNFEHPDGGTWGEHVGQYFEYNPEKARELLELGMQEEGYDELPQVTLSYNTSDLHSTRAQAMQEMLRENLGIEIELFNQEWEVFRERYGNAEFHYFRGTYLGGFNDPINYLDKLLPGAGFNNGDWADEYYDQYVELVNASYEEADPSARFDMLMEAEAILMEQAIINPIYYYNRSYMLKPEVEGIVAHFVGFTDLKWAEIKDVD